jgi:Heterokaryon incompatibility protein (HET)
MSSESIPSNTDPYEWYSAFPLLPNVSIRLIRLLPLQVGETDDADLACEQLLYCLEPPERVDYVALSYTWGNPTRDKPIVDKDGTEHLENDATGPRKTRKIYYRGRGLPITQNLYDLLVLIRHREHHGWLWADAICTYPDRYRTKCCRNLRFEPQFCEGVGFAHLTCRIGKFTLRVCTSLSTFISQFRLRVALPVLRLNMTTYPCFETARISPDEDLSPFLGARRALTTLGPSASFTRMSLFGLL